jgi:hypothetical protein
MEDSAKLDIIKSFGFKYVDTEKVEEDKYWKVEETLVDRYINDTHRIFHWKSSNKFSIKDIKTTSSTFPDTFEYTIFSYLKDIIK